MEKKTRLSVYLDPDLMRSLADYAAHRDQSRSLIAEAAIAANPGKSVDEVLDRAPAPASDDDAPEAPASS